MTYYGSKKIKTSVFVLVCDFCSTSPFTDFICTYCKFIFENASVHCQDFYKTTSGSAKYFLAILRLFYFH